MARKPATKTALLYFGMIASVVAWFAVLVNKHAFDPPIYSALLFTLMLMATLFGWWREMEKERELDELELAAASFGARWGVGVLAISALLLLFVTPLQDAIVLFAESYEDNEGRPLPAPVGVFIMGFLLAVFLQQIAKSALGAMWKWTKR
jgi:hypothetical protein